MKREEQKTIKITKKKRRIKITKDNMLYFRSPEN